MDVFCVYESCSRDQAASYGCGCCGQQFVFICQLHQHLQKQQETGGSYHYDHHSRTAFPKYGSVCVYVQTSNNIQNDSEDSQSNVQEKHIKDAYSDKDGCRNIVQIAGVSNDKISYDHCEEEKIEVAVNRDKGSQSCRIDCTIQNDSEGASLDTNGLYMEKIQSCRVSSDKAEEKSKQCVIENNNYDISNVEKQNHEKIHLQLKKQSDGVNPANRNISATVSRPKRKIVDRYKCSIKDCSETFKTENDLRLHNAKHSGKRLHSCNFCGKKFVHKPALLVHLRLHKKERETRNEASDGPCLTSVGLQVKQLASVEKVHAICELCGRSFPSSAALRSHGKCHTRQQFVCTQCSKVFHTKQGLQFHSIMHEGKTFDCDICGKQYGHAHTLKKHQVQHSQDTPYKCTVCSRYFPIQSLYKKHMMTHTREKQFTCEVCGFQTHCKSSIKNHSFTHAANQFACSKCNKTFSRKAALQEHMNIHTGDKPYVCEFCAMAFAYQSALVTHRRIHTGVKPYKCEQCSKSFSLRHIFKRHMLTHTKEKPYKCSVCDKAFSQEYNRSVHMRQHTGDKPYTCQICTKSFTQKCSLKSHMKTHCDNQ